MYLLLGKMTQIIITHLVALLVGIGGTLYFLPEEKPQPIQVQPKAEAYNDSKLQIKLDSVNAKILRIESAINNIQVTTTITAKKIYLTR
jgi:hypothetical protein